MARIHKSGAIRRVLMVMLCAGCLAQANADAEYAAAWGPAIGTTVPLLSAMDQDGKSQTLDSLTGPNGLLFVFNRSVDW